MSEQTMSPQQMPNLPPSAKEVFSQAVELMRQDRLRTFKVDIESESTAFQDEQEEKQGRVEFLGAAGQFIQQVETAVAGNPKLAPLAAQMLLFGIRAFKAGRPLEAAFEQMIEDMEKSPPQSQQQGDPAAAMKAQVDGMRAQTEQASQQHNAQMEQMRMSHDQAMEQMRVRMDAQNQQHQQVMEQQRLETDRLNAHTKNIIAAQQTQIQMDRNAIARETLISKEDDAMAQRNFELAQQETAQAHERELAQLAAEQAANQAKEPA
jgi:hypothetical protein